MNAKDYESVLDSLDSTGIYVVREDDHRILYCNKAVKDLIPSAAVGMVCHELWQGSCACCPLIGIEGKNTNRSFNYDGPGHRGTDITASRVLWDDEIPAFVVTFSPHRETYGSTYEKVVKGNLTTDECVAIKMTQEERDKLPAENFTLTEALESFAHGGLLYPEDIERFLRFSALDSMSAEFKRGKRYLVCNYRRQTARGIRWNTMEVLPDDDYTDDNQSIMIYVKDVQDVYREGLEHETENIKNEAVLKALGDENFGIFLIDLAEGTVENIKSDPDGGEITEKDGENWDDRLKKAAELYSPESRGKLLECFSLSALKKMSIENRKKTEVLLERKIKGELHYVNAEAYYHVTGGRKRYAIVALRDVDAHMRKELNLIRDEKRMAEVIRSGYKMMYFPDLNTGRVEYVYMTASGEEVPGEGDYQENIDNAAERLIYPADREKFINTLSLSALRSRAAEITRHTEEIVCYRTMMEGTLKWMEQHIYFVPGENGMDIAIFGRDVTADKLREEKERKTAREKEYIVNGLNSMFLSMGYVDIKGNTLKRVVQRERVEEVLGDSTDYTELMTKYAELLVYPDDREDFLRSVSRENVTAKLSETHPVEFCEYREISGDDGGECRWIRANIVLAEKDGGVPSVALYVSQDISEIKQKEEKDKKILRDALETANFANASKSEFLSRMSHDIRTPMNAIIGMTAIAGAHLDDKERISDCLGKITVSGRHLLALINEVLDLSKIESGRVELSEEEFTLATFFDELTSLVLPQIHAREQSFECRMENIRHEKVIGDSLRLQQVFMNILSNAVKYTPQHGKIDVLVQEKTSTLSGYSYYEFTFRDNGIGMSEDYVKHIFEPFTREEKPNGTNAEGTGLGMAIARNIVQMMNGDITVKSVPGEGSVFTVSLFLKICDSKDDEIEALAELPVLVADDDEDSCKATCHILDEMGMKSEYVVSGRAAVEKTVERHKAEDDYFAVILDWKMPGMDGIETARRIRAEVGPDIPIIILSAYDWAEVEEEARAAGINGFISKPLFRSRLAYLFRQFVDNGEKGSEGSAELSEIKRHDFSGKRVMLVEDNELNREIATEIISMTGVEIECAINGAQAVKLFEKSPEKYYDLIFMDIRMPVMDGHEATKTIRALDRADAKTIPIVAMSANAFASDIITSRQSGMNEHIIKPLNFASLVACMDRWLGDNTPPRKSMVTEESDTHEVKQ